MKRTITRIIIASTVLVGAVIVYAYVQTTIARSGAELVETLGLLEREQAVSDALTQVAELVEATDADRAALEALVVRGDIGTIALLGELDTLAAANGLTVINTALEVAEEAFDPQDALSIDLTVVGLDQSVRAFVAQLETLPYGSQLNEITITRRSNEAGVLEATADLVLLVSFEAYDS